MGHLLWNLYISGNLTLFIQQNNTKLPSSKFPLSVLLSLFHKERNGEECKVPHVFSDEQPSLRKRADVRRLAGGTEEL